MGRFGIRQLLLFCWEWLLVMSFLTQIWPLVITAEPYIGHEPVNSFFTSPQITICKSVSPHVSHILSILQLARVNHENSSQIFFSSTASTITMVSFKSQRLLADIYSHLAILYMFITTIFILLHLPLPPISTSSCILMGLIFGFAYKITTFEWLQKGMFFAMSQWEFYIHFILFPLLHKSLEYCVSSVLLTFLMY